LIAILMCTNAIALHPNPLNIFFGPDGRQHQSIFQSSAILFLGKFGVKGYFDR
jgi:hypothetical protein